jgi:hypothetical protein
MLWYRQEEVNIVKEKYRKKETEANEVAIKEEKK